MEKLGGKEKKRIVFWTILEAVVVAAISICCFTWATARSREEVKQKEAERLQLAPFLQLEELEDLKKFLISHGKLVELVEIDSKDRLQNDLPIVTPDGKWQSIPIHAFGDKKETLNDIPTLLYSPDYSEVRVYFYMNCTPVWNDWEEWKIDGESPSGKDVTVIPDPNNVFYYYLDLREKGIYDMCAHAPNGSTLYFKLQW